MQESRTTKSLKNAEVSIIYYTLNLIVGFWSRKVFYDYLGSEVLGLDTTASTLLSFLNLAELGIGSAIAFFLYQPMFDKDTFKINEIVAVQGWIYRRIAFVIIIASGILMCFFPMIFKKISLPMWYPYATFSVFLFGSLLGYFVNYRQCVLEADQKGYKVTRVTSGASLALKILLIFALPVVPSPFLFYLGTNLAGSIIGSVWLNHVLKKEYPWLKQIEEDGRTLLKKYPEILKKTSQLFFHKITSFVVFNVSPLIMYVYTSLTVIAYYGNYLVIINKARDILNMAFGSTQAAVGNLIASQDKEHSLEVYWELFDSRMAISTGFLLALGLLTEPFISVWLSPTYLLSHTVLILILFSSWLMLNRATTDNYINGYGLFQDVWAPMVEGVINLGVAIIGGMYFGIEGVLMGGIVSTLIIIYGWKPYFLFTRGFHVSYLHGYLLKALGRWTLSILLLIVFVYANLHFAPHQFDNFGQIAIYALVLFCVIVPITYIAFLFTTSGTRRFNQRILSLISTFYQNRFKER